MIVMRVLNSGSNIQGNNLVFIKAISFLYFHQQYDTVAARFDELCYICIIVNFISQKTALLGIYTKLSERTVFPTLFSPALSHFLNSALYYYYWHKEEVCAVELWSALIPRATEAVHEATDWWLLYNHCLPLNPLQGRVSWHQSQQSTGWIHPGQLATYCGWTNNHSHSHLYLGSI